MSDFVIYGAVLPLYVLLELLQWNGQRVKFIVFICSATVLVITFLDKAGNLEFLADDE